MGLQALTLIRPWLLQIAQEEVLQKGPCLCGGDACQPPAPNSCSMVSCFHDKTESVKWSKTCNCWTATCGLNSVHKSIFINSEWGGLGCGRGLKQVFVLRRGVSGWRKQIYNVKYFKIWNQFGIEGSAVVNNMMRVHPERWRQLARRETKSSEMLRWPWRNVLMRLKHCRYWRRTAFSVKVTMSQDHQRHQLSRHGDWIFFSLTMVCEKTQGCKVLGQAILSKQFITIPSGWWFCDVLWWCLWAWRLLQRKAQMLPQAVHVTDMGFMGFRTSRTRSHQVGAIKSIAGGTPVPPGQALQDAGKNSDAVMGPAPGKG